MIQQLTSKERCPRCNKKEMVTDSESGEVFCGVCGFVISERTEDSGPEWRSVIAHEFPKLVYVKIKWRQAFPLRL